jgi:hypothetical protein
VLVYCRQHSGTYQRKIFELIAAKLSNYFEKSMEDLDRVPDPYHS